MGAAGTAGVGAAGAGAGAGIGGAVSKLVKSKADKKYEELEAWIKQQLQITEDSWNMKLARYIMTVWFIIHTSWKHVNSRILVIWVGFMFYLIIVAVLFGDTACSDFMMGN